MTRWQLWRITYSTRLPSCLRAFVSKLCSVFWTVSDEREARYETDHHRRNTRRARRLRSGSRHHRGYQRRDQAARARGRQEDDGARAGEGRKSAGAGTGARPQGRGELNRQALVTPAEAGVQAPILMPPRVLRGSPPPNGGG